MELFSGLCKPIVGIDCSSTVRSPAPEGQCGVDSSNMENSGMVPNIVVSASGVSIPSTSAQGVVCQVHPVPPPFQGDTVQLAAWPISGKDAERKSFLNRLQASSWHRGDLSQTQTTTHSFTSGSAGVT